MISISEEFTKNKNEFLKTIFLISIPLIFLSGSLVINVSVVLIDLFFLYTLYIKKDSQFLNNKYFYSLIIFWLYLIFNLFFSINVDESLPRSIGFIRFVLFAFAINYFFNKKTEEIKKYILFFWGVIFLLISVDLIFEFVFGFNTFGFKSPYEGRLGGVMGEELKIGHFYSAFALLTLYISYEIFKKNNTRDIIFYFLAILFLFISLIIGERSNFVKTFLMISLFIFLIDRKNFLKKIFSIIIFLIALFILIFNNPKFTDRMWGKFISPMFKNPIELISKSKYGSHYKVALQVLDNNKFFGVGLKNYREEVRDKKYDRDASIHPHQVHFEILSELGLIGYILFISVFFFILFQSIKLYLKKKDSLMLCGILFIISSLIPLLPSGSFFTTYGAALFWFNFSFILRKNT
tara:strand:+ start:659 stop:1879 length:1221 start_codon:yes stop_codon:yes gene_type:complete